MIINLLAPENISVEKLLNNSDHLDYDRVIIQSGGNHTKSFAKEEIIGREMISMSPSKGGSYIVSFFKDGILVREGVVK